MGVFSTTVTLLFVPEVDFYKNLFLIICYEKITLKLFNLSHLHKLFYASFQILLVLLPLCSSPNPGFQSRKFMIEYESFSYMNKE